MKRLLILLALGALILAACSSSDDGGAESAPTATEAASSPTVAPTTAAPTATEAPADGGGPAARPATTAAATLTQSYNSAPGGTFDPAVMGFASGDVEAQWYRADGFYIVVYEGLDLDATGPLCPGNSIQTATGFAFVSNAPTEGADCSTFPTLSADPDVGALVCQGVLSYRTAIPSTTEGNLFGTIERPVEGGFMGITGVTPTSAGVPAVDVSLLSC